MTATLQTPNPEQVRRVLTACVRLLPAEFGGNTSGPIVEEADQQPQPELQPEPEQASPHSREVPF